jgi:hypothetical protein
MRAGNRRKVVGGENQGRQIVCVGGLAPLSSNPQVATLEFTWKNDRSGSRAPSSLAVLPVKGANPFGALPFLKSALAHSLSRYRCEIGRPCPMGRCNAVGRQCGAIAAGPLLAGANSPGRW